MNTTDDSDPVLHIDVRGRYQRQELINWWDQRRICEARVLVLGAGALGNEILKLLALTGVGNILLFDMDVIEASNLARSVLFRAADAGRPKALVAAERLRELNPDVCVQPHVADVFAAAGWGIFCWADVVVCGLDNRLARIFANQACAATDRVWVDGAMEELAGIVRVFEPRRGPCYECTMNEVDRRVVRQRLSCAMLARDAAARGHVPTTAVTGSLVAALQVQEAIKWLHGQPVLSGRGIHLQGLWSDFAIVSYPRRENCAGHEFQGPFVRLSEGVDELSLEALLKRADQALGEGAVLDLTRDVAYRLECSSCGHRVNIGRALMAMRESDATCKKCGGHCAVLFTSSISRDGEVDLSRTLSDLGVPPFDVIVARHGFDSRQAWIFGGDAPAVLGPLHDSWRPDDFRAYATA